MQSRICEIIGFIIAPLSPIFVALLFSAEGNSDILTSSTSRTISLLITAVSYFWTIAFGVPTHLLLKRFHIHGLLAYLTAAFLSGITSAFLLNLIYLALIRQVHDWWSVATERGAFALAISVGMLSVLNFQIFWLIVRPDKQS